MDILIPDPHPGRCLNYRAHWRWETRKTVRCLDYEGHDGACTFPQPESTPPQTATTYTQTASEPEPWTSPLEFS